VKFFTRNANKSNGKTSAMAVGHVKGSDTRKGKLGKIVSYEINKRQKFILVSVTLTLVLIATQLVDVSLRFQTIGFLTVLTILLSIFALWGELSGVKYFLLLLLPAYFVAGASLFYFLLPSRWLTRVPFALAFGVSFYLLMLTANIFNVAAIRTIALLRAAYAVGLLFSLLATFFLCNVLFSFHLPSYAIAAGVAVIVFPLYLVGLWSYELDDFVSKKVFRYTVVFTLASMEVAVAFSFWPIVAVNSALAMATIMYMVLGLSQFAFQDRLKPRQVWEHLAVAMAVFIVIVISTHWG
jgi:hypothetical protein